MDIRFEIFPVGTAACKYKDKVLAFIKACQTADSLSYFYAPDAAYVDDLLSVKYETLIGFSGHEVIAVAGWLLLDEFPAFSYPQMDTHAAAINRHETAFFDGAIIHPDNRGRGLGHKLTEERVKSLRSNAGIRHILATVHPENTPSIRVLEKAGFFPLKTARFFGGQALRTLYLKKL